MIEEEKDLKRPGTITTRQMVIAFAIIEAIGMIPLIIHLINR